MTKDLKILLLLGAVLGIAIAMIAVAVFQINKIV